MEMLIQSQFRSHGTAIPAECAWWESSFGSSIDGRSTLSASVCGRD